MLLLDIADECRDCCWTVLMRVVVIPISAEFDFDFAFDFDFDADC